MRNKVNKRIMRGIFKKWGIFARKNKFCAFWNNKFQLKIKDNLKKIYFEKIVQSFNKKCNIKKFVEEQKMKLKKNYFEKFLTRFYFQINSNQKNEISNSFYLRNSKIRVLNLIKINVELRQKKRMALRLIEENNNNHFKIKKKIIEIMKNHLKKRLEKKKKYLGYFRILNKSILNRLFKNWKQFIIKKKENNK